MSMTEERVFLSRKAPVIQEKEQIKGGQQSGDAPSDDEKKKRSTGMRVTLWILRKSIVPLIMLVMLVTGLYVGYVVLGKQPGDEVFHWSTWQHLYDLVFAES